MLVTQPSPVGAPKGTAQSDALPAWKDIVAPAEPFLKAVAERLAQQIQAFEGDVATYAEYALCNQGKQLRPVLVALSGGATGQTSDDHVLAAVIVEMVHLATLVHDDVMDEARIRRGRPTLAANWGHEISVLVGDCLFAHALQLAASFPTPEICRAVAAATNTVCAGEILQTQRRRNIELSRAEYFQVIQMKTGELFALSCDLGAYLSGAGAVQRSALRQYGLAIGTAYQVYDDCLDLFGSETVVGKSLGTDLAKGKLTLPMLLALEGADAVERATLESMVRDWTPRDFPRLLELLVEHGTLDGSRLAVQQHAQAARQALAALPEGECRDSLAGLCVYLARQTAALGPA
jgi:octaprenyl-diphosphate synthase